MRTLLFSCLAALITTREAAGLNLQEFTQCIGPQGKGPVCQLDAGTYSLSSQLYFTRSNITIKGTIITSPLDTVLQRAPGWHYGLLVDSGPPTAFLPVANITIRDLTFDGNRSQQADPYSSYFSELDIATTKSVLVTNCYFINSPGHSFVVLGSGASGIVINNSFFQNSALFAFITNPPVQILTTSPLYQICATLTLPDDILIANSRFDNSGEGIFIDATNLRVVNNVFNNNHSYPVPYNDDGGQFDLDACTDNAAVVGNVFQNGNAASTGHHVAGIEVHAADVSLVNNNVRNNQQDGIDLLGVEDVFVANWDPATSVTGNGGNGIAVFHVLPLSPGEARPNDSIIIDSAVVTNNGSWGLWTDSPDAPITHFVATHNCFSGNLMGPMQLNNVTSDALIQNNLTKGCGGS